MTLANPYLLGNYAPVAGEETVTDLSVTGSLPNALNGRYLRNGPNPITPPDPATYHWFTGDGMVHGLGTALPCGCRSCRGWYRRHVESRSASNGARIGEVFLVQILPRDTEHGTQ
jgi:carotenoid cleavage dioxygenase-like enzyme